MDRAALGHLGKSRPLGVVECASESDFCLDSLDHASFGVVALQTVLRMHTSKLYRDVDALQRDPFVVRVEAEGNGHARRERSKQNLVGGGPFIRSAGHLRLVRQPAELMAVIVALVPEWS